ncbi:Uncharacterised protein [BD1-7 clade bacterium]|uniref:DUF2889 domain-containing protein n=1 Tax=BD1-7 clade bacterium TaxID=2029982 RepID=A0A5S9QCC8_9GAMM|nr:Uncharacterised protein [BD1-7 clade bacterium]
MQTKTHIDPENPLGYPLNPQYGQGTYHRAIRLVPGQDPQKGHFVDGAMEDCNHGFTVRLYHDTQQVTALEAQPKRVPFTTCPKAAEPLKQLIGMPLNASTQALISQLNPSAQCTHWMDLALLTLAHAGRATEKAREYTIDVPDEDTHTDACVYCDGQLIHCWQLKDWTIMQPQALAGSTLYKGFARWANETFVDSDQREAAFVLQKGYFVSRARRFDLQKMAGEEANTHTIMVGACFTYSKPQIDNAQRTSGTTRDFTSQSDKLLTFS